MQTRGMAAAGAALYPKFGPQSMTFRAGLSIAREDIGRAKGAAAADMTPAGQVAHGTRMGAYGGLRDSYAEMHGFVPSEEREFTLPCWEVFLSSLDEVAEADLLTVLYRALA